MTWGGKYNGWFIHWFVHCLFLFFYRLVGSSVVWLAGSLMSFCSASGELTPSGTSACVWRFVEAGVPQENPHRRCETL